MERREGGKGGGRKGQRRGRDKWREKDEVAGEKDRGEAWEIVKRENTGQSWVRRDEEYGTSFTNLAWCDILPKVWRRGPTLRQIPRQT